MLADNWSTDAPPKLEVDLLPVAAFPLIGDVDALFGLISLRGTYGAIDAWPPHIRGTAERAAYAQTLHALGLIDEDGALSPPGHELLGAADRPNAFLAAFSESRVGRAWTYWQGVKDAKQLDSESATKFVEVFSAAKGRAQKAAAQALTEWVTWCQRPLPISTLRSGLAYPTATTRQNMAWPSHTTFPHNEGGESVRNVVMTDLARGPILVIVGYAALAELIPFLSKQLEAPSRPVRLLFGNEPFPKTRSAWPVAVLSLADEVQQYWHEFGFSVTRSAEILQAREVVAAMETSVRIAGPKRPLHAKVYLSESAVTIGSSNFTTNGLQNQSEANARFVATDPRYREACRLAEGFWEGAVDYKNELLDLLDRLLKEVTWQEALGRACAEILEGHWADKYIPPAELAALTRPLWPHQRQGISQAIWALQNVGSVLVADATGSGKTRMGAWLLRAVYDWRIRQGHGPRPRPLVIAPQGVTERWESDLLEAGLPWRVNSSGVLSNVRARAFEYLKTAVEDCELLAVDEAHNYLNQVSNRTQRLLANTSDNAVLFTATPISRRASDLLGLVDLLGTDHFSADAQTRLERISAYERGTAVEEVDDRDALRREIQSFMVRRTRQQLNEFAAEQPDAYRLPSGRVARYPKISVRTYDLPLDERDAHVAAEIAQVADELVGIARVGKSLSLTELQREEGISEESYLRRLAESAAALARHSVLDCLRSSRAALLEHVMGTDAAIGRVAPTVAPNAKKATGNTLKRLQDLAGTIPKWELRDVAVEAAPPWLTDTDAHARMCEEEQNRYRQIAALAECLSDARERAKCAHLERLSAENRKIICFDSHNLSLHLFKSMLAGRGLLAEVLTGDDGEEGKRHAVKRMGLNADEDSLIALCSDAFSESINLQKASVVVHLDFPTVIREAEQRVGRIDRMDSPHDQIQVWFPDESGGFTPRRRDLLRERHEVVAELIGANLQLPDQAKDDPLKPEDLAATHSALGDADELFDAFRAVRAIVAPGGLVGPETYAQMRATQDRIVSCVGLVRSTSCWGFFAVGSESREAPRWVLLDDGGTPKTDLLEISRLLGERLREQTEKLSLLDADPTSIERLIFQLTRQERRLLPLRRQRLLDLAERVLRRWFLDADAAGDEERVEVLRRCQRLLVPPNLSDEVPHLRTVADIWSALTRTYKQEALQRRSRKKRWGLDALEPPLLEKPIPTAVLRSAFEEVRLIPSLDRRIVAMIIGMPSGGSGGE